MCKRGVHHTDAPFECPAFWKPGRPASCRIYLWVVAFFLLCVHSLTLACSADHIDERTTVRHVYDGDTIKTTRNLKIRFIGINTPELGHGQHPHQPFALRAREQLQELLQKHQNQIQLRYDQQAKDKYHRDLAHIYLQDGTNLSRWLLEQGLATTLIIPPNTWNADCYREAEQQARQHQRGIWGLPAYQPVDSHDINPSDKGFRLVRGKVKRIGHSAKSIWINLEGGVALRISRQDLPYFDENIVSQLKDKTVIAQGWLYASNHESRMHIRHPAALRVE